MTVKLDPALEDDYILPYDNEQTNAINANIDEIGKLTPYTENVIVINGLTCMIKKYENGILELNGTYHGTPNSDGKLDIPLGEDIIHNPTNVFLPTMTPHYNITPNVLLVVSAPTANSLICYLNRGTTGAPIVTGQRVSFNYRGLWKAFIPISGGG